MNVHYLIDYENVREEGLSSIQPGSLDDIIYLFYTVNAAKISLDALAGLAANLRIIKVPAGKQSLDMHLVSYLGYLVARYGAGDSYVVVSKDTGFDGVIDFWKSMGIPNIRRQACIRCEHPSPGAAAPAAEAKTSAEPKISAESKKKSKGKDPEQGELHTQKSNQIIKALSAAEVSPEICGKIASTAVKHLEDEKSKQLIYREIIRQFGQKEGLQYYNLIRKLL